jgi:hypothetical protein
MKHVGKRALWSVANVKVEVKTIDARISFGRIDVRITPVAGTGETWVDSQFLDIKKGYSTDEQGREVVISGG